MEICNNPSFLNSAAKTASEAQFLVIIAIFQRRAKPIEREKLWEIIIIFKHIQSSTRKNDLTMTTKKKKKDQSNNSGDLGQSLRKISIKVKNNFYKRNKTTKINKLYHWLYKYDKTVSSHWVPLLLKIIKIIILNKPHVQTTQGNFLCSPKNLQLERIQR